MSGIEKTIKLEMSLEKQTKNTYVYSADADSNGGLDPMVTKLYIRKAAFVLPPDTIHLTIEDCT